MQLPDPIPWRLHSSLSMSVSHHLAYRVEGFPVQKEVFTPFRNGKPGKPDVSYWIDGDDRQFRSEAELRKAMEERG